MTQSGYVRTERDEALARIIIDRSDKANALLPDMMAVIAQALREASDAPDVDAIVIRGAGARAFSGGVDVRTPSDLPAEEAVRLRSRRFFELLLAVCETPKPVVAAVNGVASGGGAMLALVADASIAAETAAIAMPEIDLGSPAYPALAILTHLAGAGVAGDLVQTGRRMGAPEAAARGLFSRAVPAEALDETAAATARLLGGKPARAFAANKAWLRRPLIAALHETHEGMAAMRRGGH